MEPLVPTLVVSVALRSGLVGFAAGSRRANGTAERETSVYRRGVRAAAVPALAFLLGLETADER